MTAREERVPSGGKVEALAGEEGMCGGRRREDSAGMEARRDGEGESAHQG